MALVLVANYSKKLGLPGYSSHQYSVTVRAELPDVSQVEAESKRLYALLQSCVDRELQSTGFLPGQAQNGNGAADEWKCSAKQKELVLKIVEEQKLNKAEVEHLSFKLFGIGVRSLNKLQASSLISELSVQVPSSSSPSPAPKARRGDLKIRIGCAYCTLGTSSCTNSVIADAFGGFRPSD